MAHSDGQERRIRTNREMKVVFNGTINIYHYAVIFATT